MGKWRQPKLQAPLGLVCSTGVLLGIGGDILHRIPNSQGFLRNLGMNKIFIFKNIGP
jgi:hypothetical protein